MYDFYTNHNTVFADYLTQGISRTNGVSRKPPPAILPPVDPPPPPLVPPPKKSHQGKQMVKEVHIINRL